MKTGITIQEMASEVARQSSAKADYGVDTRFLEMEANGAGIAMRILEKEGSDFIEPLDVNPIAHRQIGTHVNIPAKYYDRMLDTYPELLAMNVNAWFKHEPAQRMLRTLDGTARAFLSSSYRRIDNLEILKTVLPILDEIKDAQFKSCQITDSRMYIKVINPRLQAEVSVGDIVQAGVMITNSEVGHGSFSVQPLILRLVCMNGMVVNNAKTRRIHRGSENSVDDNYLLYSDETLAAEDHAFMLKIQDTVKAAVDEARFSQVVGMMRSASEARMTTTDVPAVVKLASRDFKLSENEESGILNRLIEEHNFTLYGLANAVTRHSQDIESYDRATELESIGFDILTMDRQHWNRLNRTAIQATA
ncbi:MAG: DUF932 domain-containing protein [Peptococcaceae bacterium]|jgi:hypothetical protein|nr:DUF932 domain-containing protein [Peptococcaceae bacterium]